MAPSDLALAEAACARVLAQLSTLADVNPAPLSHGPEARPGRPRTDKDQAHVAQRLPKRTQTAESRLPPGVRGTAKPGREEAPSKTLSLHGHYQWRMKRAQRRKDVTALYALAAMARRDYEDRTEAVRRFPTEEDAVDWLLSEFHGCSSEEAAAWMATPLQTQHEARRWVRHRRVMHGRDPDDGTLVETDPEVRRTLALAVAGASERAIADEVGITRSEVRRILDT